MRVEGDLRGDGVRSGWTRSRERIPCRRGVLPCIELEAHLSVRTLAGTRRRDAPRTSNMNSPKQHPQEIRSPFSLSVASRFFSILALFVSVLSLTSPHPINTTLKSPKRGKGRTQTILEPDFLPLQLVRESLHLIPLPLLLLPRLAQTFKFVRADHRAESEVGRSVEQTVRSELSLDDCGLY
jgi:hypothetical protein